MLFFSGNKEEKTAQTFRAVLLLAKKKTAYIYFKPALGFGERDIIEGKYCSCREDPLKYTIRHAHY